MKILIVDNNKNSQKLLEHMIDTIGGGIVKTVNSGLDAILALREEPYDVVFMDIRMPVFDGLETAHAIKRDKGCNQSYLIALTAGTQGHFEVEKEHALACGFDDYILKPFSLDALQRKLSQIVHGYKICA